MKRRSLAFAGAAILLYPMNSRADAGLPQLSSPDWSSLSAPQWAGVGLALTLTIAWLGVWTSKHPAAALGCLLWLLGLPFLLIGGYAILLTVVLRTFLPLPFAAVGLGIAVGGAIAGYRVMKANGEWSIGGVVPGFVGLFALALILCLTGSNLRWTEPQEPIPPNANPPPAQPRASKVPRGGNL